MILLPFLLLCATIATSPPGNLRGESGASGQFQICLRAPPGTSGEISGGPLKHLQIICLHDTLLLTMTETGLWDLSAPTNGKRQVEPHAIEAKSKANDICN